MALLVQRDDAAFAELVRRHVDAVHRYLVRLTGSPDDADDLAQETFLRVWQRAGSYRPGTVRLSTWLHRIAHNLAVDAARRIRPARLDEVDAAPDVIDELTDPARTAASDQLSRRLDLAIARLPASQRAALLLCQVQGFANRDAAAIMGVSVRGVESLLARARRTLREALASTFPDDIDTTDRGATADPLEKSPS
jgi:RNA polymerase sigma-70 factor, ECF subfamily